MHYTRTSVVLPTVLQPFQSNNLIRLGQDNDGGYIVENEDIEKSDSLIALGISDDWSFEEDFYTQKPCPILAYDGSISSNRFLKSGLKTLRFPSRFQAALGLLRTWKRYNSFFVGNKNHYEAFVGQPSPQSVSIGDIFKTANSMNVNRPFMKIDIEASEYRILDQLIEMAQHTTGLAIEFHDCDLHIERILKFTQEYPLKLVHTHCNNFSPVSEAGIPLSLELTFSASCKSDEKAQTPHALDMPNKATKADYAIEYV